MQAYVVAVETADGHRAELMARIPGSPRASLLWLPALGVTARHYLPLAEALAGRGIAVWLHEWRGAGSSSLRAAPGQSWGYRELLADIAASERAVAAALPAQQRVIGGHSLGGQLACCHLALQPDAASALWLVASGSPYWRAFPIPARWWLPPAYRFLPWLARRRGVLPGRTIGFAGNEARGVIADWAGTALSGRYAAAGLEADLDAGMAAFSGEVRALSLARDWMAPPSSLAFLAGKLAGADVHAATFDDARLGTRADHFAWMREPGEVARFLAG
jgi:predicted alpha/beta hydrolase